VVEATRTGENAGQFTIMLDDVSLLEVAAHGSVDNVLDFLYYCVTLTSEMVKDPLMKKIVSTVASCYPIFKSFHLFYVLAELLPGDPHPRGYICS